MKALTRSEILAIDDLPRQKVKVPEWNGYVYVRTMTALERGIWEKKFLQIKDSGVEVNFETIESPYSYLVALLTVDEEGKNLFTQADIPALDKKSAKALNRIFAMILKLNRITAADLDELTTELEENPFDSSASDLH